MKQAIKHEPYVMIAGYAKLAGYSMDQLAAKLSITRRTLDHKISGFSDFTLTEAKVLQRILNREHDDIFLTSGVAQTPQTDESE